MASRAIAPLLTGPALVRLVAALCVIKCLHAAGPGLAFLEHLAECAAAIMQAPDRVAALRTNEHDYHAGDFAGGIQASDKVPVQEMTQLKANTRLMGAVRRTGNSHACLEGSARPG